MAKFPVKEIYPIWCYNRRGRDEKGKLLSDAPWVYKQMLHVPLEHKQKVADRYEIIYQNPTTVNNRKRANKFLSRIARYFYNESKKPKLKRNNHGS